MITRTLPDLNSFTDWIRQSDDHAEHHLALLSRVERLLGSRDDAVTTEGENLAQKLQRWRYQHLNEHASCLSSRDNALVDVLDVVSRRLAGRPPLEPRGTRHAVHDQSLRCDSVDEAIRALDPSYPLSDLIDRATQLTVDNFAGRCDAGSIDPSRRKMLLYAPLYVSSECVNFCTYCGFRYPLDIARRHLTIDQALDQAQILRDWSFRYLLIVGGDFPSQTTPAYYRDIIAALVNHGVEPSIEIAPQSIDAYADLVSAGTCGLTLYQETYDECLYAQYHVRGPKSSYHWRLESHDRAAEAGMPRLGLGILLGLADPRDDLPAMMRHALYLQQRFPDRTIAFSLPRIHEAPDDFEIRYPVSDEDLIRFYAALRVGFPDAVLVLSTREPTGLRNRLARICITQMSAGSSTAPGGYQSRDDTTGEQFPVADHRSPAEVADWLQGEGFEVCWSPSECHGEPSRLSQGTHRQ
jgi:2-iminoacetate synthase